MGSATWLAWAPERGQTKADAVEIRDVDSMYRAAEVFAERHAAAGLAFARAATALPIDAELDTRANTALRHHLGPTRKLAAGIGTTGAVDPPPSQG
jgi:hypothetical protein